MGRGIEKVCLIDKLYTLSLSLSLARARSLSHTVNDWERGGSGGKARQSESEGKRREGENDRVLYIPKWGNDGERGGEEEEEVY